MTSAMLVSIALWTVMAAVTLGLAIYRKSISRHEMDVVHIRDTDAALIPGQEALARRLDKIDLWGKLLTAAIVVFGLLLGALYLYNAWQASTTLAG